MSVPILRLNVDDEPKVIVKLDQETIIYTGHTEYNFVPSGGTTIVETTTGNVKEVVIHTLLPDNAIWGGIMGDITNQSDLNQVLTGHTEGINTNSQAIIEVNQSVDAHKNDSTIHYPQSGITITMPQVQGLQDELTSKINSTEAQGLIDISLGDYWTSTETQNAINSATSGGTTGGTGVSSWNDLTGKPQWLSGTTLQAFEQGHNHDQYITGVTWNDVQDKPEIVSMDELTNHTGDPSIHFTQDEINIPISQVQDLQTSLDGKSDTGHTHNFGVADIDGLQLALDTKSDTGHTHSQYITDVTWDDVEGKPDLVPLSGFTNHTGDDTIHFTQGEINIEINQVNNLQSSLDTKSNTGHTHSEYLTDVTWDDVQGKPELFTGYDFISSGNTTVEVSGNNVTIYTPTGGTSTVSTLDDLTNVNITTPASNDILKYSGGTWYNETPVDIFTVDIFTDVADGELLVREGAGISGVPSSTYKLKYNPIVTVSTNTTLDETYTGKIIEATGTITITLPNSMPVGMQVDIVNKGTGVITLAATTTLQSAGTKLSTQFKGASAYHAGSNVWVAVGALTT